MPMPELPYTPEERRAQKREQRRRRRAQRAAAGLCKCGRDRMPGHRTCIRCLEQANRHERARKQRIKAAGLCTKCGKREHAPGRVCCASCIVYGRSYSKAHGTTKRTGGLVYLEWKNQGCVDCPPGTVWPLCAMDAHHLEGKDRKISWQTMSAAQVLEELDKCVPICANHHRIRQNGIRK